MGNPSIHTDAVGASRHGIFWGTMVVKAKDGNLYMLLFNDDGFPHPEDKGLWQAYKVEWDWKRGEWQYNDDDVWMLTDDLKVVAREIGWDRRRETL